MKNRYLRIKGSVKRRLGASSESHSSTSLPQTRTPSPVPLETRPSATPIPISPDAGGHPSSEATAASSLVPPIPSSVSATQGGHRVQQPDPTLVISTSDNLSLVNSKPAPNQVSTTTPSWPGLNLLLKALNSTADIFPQFKAAINEFHDLVKVFEIASEERNAYHDLRATLDTLLGDISQHLGGVTSSRMTASLKNLCSGINAELLIVEQKITKSALRTHIEAMEDPEQVLECYRRIQWYLERLSLNANLSVWETVDELAREARLQRLSPTNSAVYNSAKSEEIQRRSCTEGTRQEELARLLDWARNKHGEEVYWINGMAGTGKTTIAYSVCTELETTAELGASFFCSRLIPECRDVKLIIPAIAYQLARFSLPFCSVLLNILKSDPDIHTRMLKIQFESLIVKPLSEVKHALPVDFVVVIDALDECENEDSVGQILDLLISKISTLHLPVRFLISSRPEPQIYSRMMDEIYNKCEARLVLHELDDKKVKLDIETYLKAELKQVRLTSSQLAALANHSGVLFIYASTAARYIKDGLPFRNHVKRLNMILGLAPPSEDGKDRDIDPLYASILKSAFENRHLDRSDRTLMKTLLDVVICAQEPMTVEGLSGLLRLEDAQQVDGLLRPLGSVLNISESSGLVNTLHASFPDFMQDHTRSVNSHCESRKVHAQITRACFTVIGVNDPQFNICSLDSSHLRDKELPDLTKRVDGAIPAQLFYACRYLATHLELGEPDDGTCKLVHEFLTKRLLLWMEVLNLRESMHLGPRALQRIAGWSSTNGYSKEAADLAHDAWRFVTMYTSQVVSQSTPHIYVSMLPFWPESAPVSGYYTKRMRGAIQVHGSAMTRRQLEFLATWQLGDDVWSVCISPDESLIACAVGSSVHVIDGTTGRSVLGPLEHSDRVKAVAFSPNGALLVSCSNDKTVKLWDTNNGRLVAEPYTGHLHWVNTVAFSPDCKRVISGSRDGTIHVRSLEGGCLIIGPLPVERNGVWSLCVSSDGTRVASSHSDGTIHVWDTKNGQKLLGPFIGHTECIRTISFSSDDMHLASGSDDSTIRIWSNLNDQINVEILEGHDGPVYSVAFSPEGKQLVSGSYDYTVRLWDIEGGSKLARVLEGHINVVWCARFSSTGGLIVSSSSDQTIRVWDARSHGSTDDPLEGHKEPIPSVALSHDGNRIVSGSNDEQIYIWDVRSGEICAGPMKGHSDWVNFVCFSPDGLRIASSSNDRTIRLWDARTGQAVGQPLTSKYSKTSSVCFSPDGALLAASDSEDNAIQLWDAQSGESIDGFLNAHTDWIRGLCFSPDSSQIISSSDDKTIIVWDVKSRKPILPPFTGHTGRVWAVCRSPDGTRIASGGEDATVRLWDVDTHQAISTPLTGHTSDVSSLCFAPDGVHVVSSSYDKTIRIWSAHSMQLVGSPLVGHTYLVRSVAFSPSGGLVVSGSEEGSIRVWDVADMVKVPITEDITNQTVEPPSINQSWVLQDDGWVVDSQSRLLAWVPPDLHTSLMSPRNSLLISTRGSVRLDLESAKLGESWAECYKA